MNLLYGERAIEKRVRVKGNTNSKSDIHKRYLDGADCVARSTARHYGCISVVGGYVRALTDEMEPSVRESDVDG